MIKAMKVRYTLSVLAIAGSSLAASNDARVFGKPLAGLPAARLADVLGNPQDGQKVRLEGTIEKVCQNKGCWITLREGEQRVHVTFEGYSFFLPKDSAARAVVLEGKVVVKEPDPAQVAHLKSEGGGTSAAARVSIEASGVEVR
jgi:uncharacterized protein DUF4920